MNAESKGLKLLLLQAAEYWGQELSDIQFQLFHEDLSDLPLEAVANAFRHLRRNPKITRMPLPAQIREVVCPTIPERDEAIDIANRIIAAFHRRGYTWPDTCKYDHKTWPQAFIDECGDAAWALVCHMGGFMKVYSEWNDPDVSTSIFFAQLRDRAEAFLKRARLGLQDIPPSLPKPSEREQTKQLEGPQRLDVAALLKTAPAKIQGDNEQ